MPSHALAVVCLCCPLHSGAHTGRRHGAPGPHRLSKLIWGRKVGWVGGGVSDTASAPKPTDERSARVLFARLPQCHNGRKLGVEQRLAPRRRAGSVHTVAELCGFKFRSCAPLIAVAAEDRWLVDSAAGSVCRGQGTLGRSQAARGGFSPTSWLAPRTGGRMAPGASRRRPRAR
eukprot:scaffold116344_cov51-Phaeocystis_antarctica.AAC.1